MFAAAPVNSATRRRARSLPANRRLLPRLSATSLVTRRGRCNRTRSQALQGSRGRFDLASSAFASSEIRSLTFLSVLVATFAPAPLIFARIVRVETRTSPTTLNSNLPRRALVPLSATFPVGESAAVRETVKVPELMVVAVVAVCDRITVRHACCSA